MRLRLNWSVEGGNQRVGGCKIIVEVGKILGPLAGAESKVCVPGASRQQRRGLEVVSTYHTIPVRDRVGGYACLRDA